VASVSGEFDAKLWAARLVSRQRATDMLCATTAPIAPFMTAMRTTAAARFFFHSARDTTLNRLVAIKVLLPAIANDPDRLARFRREAQVPDARRSDRERGDPHQRGARYRLADRGRP
jgi:serine/threonine protein kinase